MVSEAASLQERTWARAAANAKPRWWSRKRGSDADPDSLAFVLPKDRFSAEDALVYALKWTYNCGRYPEVHAVLPSSPPEEIAAQMPAEALRWFTDYWHVLVACVEGRYSLWGKLVRWFNIDQTLGWFMLPITVQFAVLIVAGFGVIHPDSGNLVNVIVSPYYMVRDAAALPWMKVGHYDRWGSTLIFGSLVGIVWPTLFVVNLLGLLT